MGNIFRTSFKTFRKRKMFESSYSRPQNWGSYAYYGFCYHLTDWLLSYMKYLVRTRTVVRKLSCWPREKNHKKLRATNRIIPAENHNNYVHRMRRIQILFKSMKEHPAVAAEESCGRKWRSVKRLYTSDDGSLFLTWKRVGVHWIIWKKS